MESVKVDSVIVEKIAKLARINLSEAEVEKFSSELKDVLDVFKALDDLDVSGIEPSFQPIEVKDNMREDKAEECLSQDESLSNAKNKQDGFFKGPKVMDR